MLPSVLSASFLCMLFVSHVVTWRNVTLVEVCLFMLHVGHVSLLPHSPVAFLHLGIPKRFRDYRPNLCVLAVHTPSWGHYY